MKVFFRSMGLGVCIFACSTLVMAVPPKGKTPSAKAKTPPVRRLVEFPGGDDVRLDAIWGKGASNEWLVAGGNNPKQGPSFSLTNDVATGKLLFVSNSKTITFKKASPIAAGEIKCLIRLAGEKGGSFSLMLQDESVSNSAPFGISVRANRGDSIALAAFNTRQNYKLRAYDVILPTWSEAVRIPLERDMASVPSVSEKWISIRLVFGPEGTKAWVDDRLVAIQRESVPPTPLSMSFAFSGEVEFTGLALESATVVSSGFEALSLKGYAQDRALVGKAGVADGSLPFGQTKTIDGIPFTFAARFGKDDNDHVDIGRSFVRQGNMQGYFSVNGPLLGGAFTLDPARIQLRFPQDTYDALYVIAGFDEEPNSIPRFSASFYRPGAGFQQVFDGTVPALTAKKDASAVPVPVTLDNGKKINLWMVKVPLDPARLASFSDLPIVEMELTKDVRLFRSYPDPITYTWLGAGLPSGVHIYALTLHRAPVALDVQPVVFGHVWTEPEVPTYLVSLANRTEKPASVKVAVTSRSYDGKESTAVQERTVKIPPHAVKTETFTFPVKRNGIHLLTATLGERGNTWVETRQFARLAKDTRAPYWQEGKGPLFGYWSYAGGHYTPPATNIMLVMKAAGAKAVQHAPRDPDVLALYNKWQWHEGGFPRDVSVGGASSWASKEPLDQEKYLTVKTNTIANIRKNHPGDPEVVTFFSEPSISRDLTSGHPPEYWGDPPYAMNEDEKNGLRAAFVISKAAAEGVRKTWPKAKILIPYGDTLYVVPFLRNGFPKELIDGSGLDMVGFERLPEQQLAQMSTHRLYILKEEFKKIGIPDPMMAYVEGVFVTTEPGSLTWQEQAERYHRWALISMAYGVERFYAGWFAFDCGSWYGAEHYGGCGIQRRIPYCDPKPAYAHLATMTRLLDQSKFDRWLPTGSHTAYCLKFNRPSGGPAYVLWTVRGSRPFHLTLEKDLRVSAVDSMDNATPLASTNKVVSLVIGTSPIYILGAGDVQSVALGKPDNSDSVEWSRRRNVETWRNGPVPPAEPIAKVVSLGTLGDGRWKLSTDEDKVYTDNNFDVKRFYGAMSAQVVQDEERPGAALAVHLEKQEKERQLMPWYRIIKPARPVEIPGKAEALGLWVKAASDWGRVVYCLRDAKGERWINIGTRDQWNCNDTHGWSSFNFDGWRYLRFELPSHSEYDSYREFGTTWWGHYEGDGIVDLPLKIESIIVERRTHVLYVNDIQPADPADVLLSELSAEYTTEFNATADAVAMNRLRMPLPKGDYVMSNPIVEMEKNGELPPIKLEKVVPPEWGYDGTRCHVHFQETEIAKEYQVWVSAYPDGRGAVVLGTMKKSGGLVNNLRPAMKLYLWVTYSEVASKGKASPKKPGMLKTAANSKPSNRLEIELVDAFSQK